MTFEEEFPSLKELIVKNKNTERGVHYEEDSNVQDSNFWVSDLDVQKHCLDKQKLRDIVIKNKSGLEYIGLDLRTELGLDKKQ